MTAVAQRYRARADAFRRRTEATGDGQRSRPSPCEGRAARDVVGHVAAMREATLRPLGRRPGPAPDAAGDPLRAFPTARPGVAAAVGAPALTPAPCAPPPGSY